MCILYSKHNSSYGEFFGWAALVLNLMLSQPDGSFAQNDSGEDQFEAKPEIGICGGVILRPIDIPQRLEKPSVALFSINPTFDQSVTPAQRTVLQQASNEWDALIDSSGFNPGSYPITFRYGPLTGPLAQTSTSFNSSTGNLNSAVIVFDNDGSTTWFEDATPADDSEFQASQGPSGFDLLSVARHEIGHAVGWTGTARVTALLSGDVFDPNLLNIVTASDSAHTDPSVHVNDIMNPAIGPTVRRPLSLYPTVAMVSQAFRYWISQLRCVFSGNSGPETGSVYQPWRTVQQGLANAPLGSLLLVGADTYREIVPLTRATALEITVPRGGTAVITEQ